jgi:hypothetical protein
MDNLRTNQRIMLNYEQRFSKASKHGPESGNYKNQLNIMHLPQPLRERTNIKLYFIVEMISNTTKKNSCKITRQLYQTSISKLPFMGNGSVVYRVCAFARFLINQIYIRHDLV